MRSSYKATKENHLLDIQDAQLLNQVQKSDIKKNNIANTIQAKLTVGSPNDKYKKEADAMAHKVMRMPENGLIQRKCTDCEEEDKVQRKPLASFIQKKGAQGGMMSSDSVSNQINSSSEKGIGLSRSTKSFMESRFGTDFSNVNIHTGGQAIQMNRDLNAKAFTVGNDIYFNKDQYDPGSNEGKHLLAHELTHTLQQKPNNNIIQRKPKCASTLSKAISTVSSYTKFALLGLGEIIPWSAALHPEPRRYRREEHDQTCFDLQRGTKVVILGKSSKWLFIQTMGKAGFVSQELVIFNITPELSKPSFEKALERIETQSASLKTRTFIELLRHKVFKQIVESHPDYSLKVNLATLKVSFSKIKDAFLILKKAENKPLKLTSGEQKLRKIAAVQLKATGKYVINPTNSKIEFDTSSGNKIKINSIEDFILFVEKVEDTYSSADAKEVVSEIRQMWFSDTNWEVLVASKGISERGKFVDIETEPDPIAKMFDMADLAPSGGKEKLINTPLGRVAISHVIAGIDAHLSGAPSTSQAKQHLKERGRNEDDGILKHKTLTKQHGGDPSDFATWSGDIGQAYAEYLVDKYIKKNKSSTLKPFINSKATDEQLLADIHGYIAIKVWATIPVNETPSGGKKTVSNILRDLYLVDKKGANSKGHPTQIPRSYKHYFEQATGKSGGQLKQHIIERSLKFASPWFAKKAVSHQGWWDSDGWTKEGLLENTMNEFENKHKDNEKNASDKNKIGGFVDKFLKKLKDKMP